jgi:hypothetical protein
MTRATWKWTASNEAYLTARGESSQSPRARVYACMASPKGSLFLWTLTVESHPVAVCTDPDTAMKLARALDTR